MHLYLRDLNQDLCEQWEKVFSGVDEVTVECGDIFRTPVDAAVSPANSFGWMTGGIDGHYVRVLGTEVERRVRERIGDQLFGELLVGQSIIVDVDGSPHCKHLIAAPTMRTPGPTTQLAVFLSTRAAVLLALSQKLSSVAMPGMGTLTGMVPLDLAAQAMREGYDDALRFWDGRWTGGFA